MIVDTSAERQLATIQELSRRWHRVQNNPRAEEFDGGRACGYAQSIALLLDKPYIDVVRALQVGEL